MTSPFVPFSVYQVRRKEKLLSFRYIASDGQGNCSLYDLNQNKKTRTRKFTVISEAEFIVMLGGDLTPAVDSWRNKLPKEELSDHRKAERAARWGAVKRIFCPTDRASLQVGGPIFTPAIYFDSALFKKLMVEEAHRQGRKNASGLYRLFWTCVEFGGDEYAMTKRLNACGAHGVPRSTFEHSEKTGRKSAGYDRDPGSYVAANRFGRFWRRRVISAIVSAIAIDPSAASNLLESATQFRDVLQDGFCFAGGDMGVRERRKLAAAKTPSSRTFERHGMWIVSGLAQEIASLLPSSARSAGSAMDIALGDEIIADMDVTDFRHFRIAFVTDDESEMRDLGAPRVALGVVRDSDYILGYYPTIGYERTTVYMYCELSMFTSKNERLKELGFDAPLEGMQSGNVDVVLTDGGPGRSKAAVAFSLKHLKIDHVKAPPYYPQGKGNVEGSNSRLKGRAYSNLNLAEDVFEKVLDRIEQMSVRRRLALRHGQGLTPALKAREKEGIIYLRERVFEQVLVEAINEHNLAVLSKKSALTQKMFARGIAPTRLAAFREQMEMRRGDRAYARNEAEIRKAILMSLAQPAKVLHGLLTTNEGTYGGREHEDDKNVKLLMEWERAKRIERNMKGNTPVPIKVTPAPHGNVVLWHSDSGDLLPIPPTKAFLARVGSDADRSRVVAMHGWALDDKMKAKQRQADGRGASPKKHSRAARAESERIKRDRGFAPPGPAKPNSPAARLHRKEEEQTQFERSARKSRADVPQPFVPIDKESLFTRGLEDDPSDLSELQRRLRGS